MEEDAHSNEKVIFDWSDICSVYCEGSLRDTGTLPLLVNRAIKQIYRLNRALRWQLSCGFGLRRIWRLWRQGQHGALRHLLGGKTKVVTLTRLEGHTQVHTISSCSIPQGNQKANTKYQGLSWSNKNWVGLFSTCVHPCVCMRACILCGWARECFRECVCTSVCV